MIIKEIKNDKLELHFSVQIEEKNVNQAINDQLLNIAKTAKIDGFRVGKAPIHLLKKRYEDSIRFDVTKEKINETVKKIEEEKNIKALFSPDLSDLVTASGTGISFTLKYILAPEVTLPDFSTIEVQKPILEISEKDIDEQLKNMAENFTTYETKSKTKAQKGECVIIDAVGYIDGVPFDGGKLEGTEVILGEGRFIPGFEDQLIGVKAGEEVTIKVTFPKEYHAKNLQSKEAEFKTKVISVNKPTKLEVGDELAKKYKLETLDELKQEVKKDIEKSYESEIRISMKKELFDKLEKILTFEVPDSMVEKEIEVIKHQIDKIEKEHTHDESCTHDHGKDHDAEYQKNLAIRRVRVGFLVAEYINEHKVTIDDKYMNEYFIRMFGPSAQFMAPRMMESIKNDQEAINRLHNTIMEEKAVDLMLQTVNLKEKKYTRAKLETFLDQD